jgi:hypothetical protein
MKQIVINEKVAVELADIMNATTSDVVKNAKLLNKSFGIDKTLANFISNPEPKGVSIVIDKVKRAKMWEAVLDAGMLTDLNKKRALCLASLNADIELHVKSVADKLTKKGSVHLTEEQKDAFTKALVKYRNAVERQIMPAINDIAIELGLATEKKVQAEVPALVG